MLITIPDTDANLVTSVSFRYASYRQISHPLICAGSLLELSQRDIEMSEAAESNLQKSNSDRYGEVSVSYASSSLRLEWKIPLDAFSEIFLEYEAMLSGEGIFPAPTHSYLFEFKDLKIHAFYLALSLSRDRWDAPLCLKLESNLPNSRISAELEYAIVSIGDRLYYLTDSSTYNGNRLTVSKLRSLPSTQKDITVVCRVRSVANVRFAAVDSVPEHRERHLLRCTYVQNLPYIGDEDWPYSKDQDVFAAVSEYSYGGELPILNVKLAKNLLSHLGAKKDHPELKAFCVEYLMANLSPENVAEIWKVASDNQVEALVSKCYDYIREDCKLVKR